MFPVLIHYPDWFPLKWLGIDALHSYGVLVALGFFLGLLWVLKEAPKNGIDRKKASDLYMYIIISAIVGSRIMYGFTSASAEELKDPLFIFKIWEGGLVFYGGLIGAILTSFWFTYRHKLNLSLVADIYAPAVALGHGIGRLGCFCAGCCFGQHADHEAWYTVIFPENSQAPSGVPLYPTQLMEAGGELFIFVILVAMRNRKKIVGDVFLLYLTLYSILRITIENFRGDQIRGEIFGLPTSMFVSLVFLTIMGSLWLWPKGREKLWQLFTRKSQKKQRPKKA